MNHKICSKNYFTPLFLLYLVCVIPVIVIYYMHGTHELEESDKLKALGNETKAIKTQAEGTFLLVAAWIYVIATIIIGVFPKNPIAYLIVIVLTLVAIIVWLGRSEFGIPIPGTDLTITKFVVGPEGFWTKSLQAILLVPISILLARYKSIS